MGSGHTRVTMCFNNPFVICAQWSCTKLYTAEAEYIFDYLFRIFCVLQSPRKQRGIQDARFEMDCMPDIDATFAHSSTRKRDRVKHECLQICARSKTTSARKNAPSKARCSTFYCSIVPRVMCDDMRLAGCCKRERRKTRSPAYVVRYILRPDWIRATRLLLMMLLFIFLTVCNKPVSSALCAVEGRSPCVICHLFFPESRPNAAASTTNRAFFHVATLLHAM